jgi:carboxylesterase type B
MGPSDPIFLSSIKYGSVDSIGLQLNLALPAHFIPNSDYKYPLLIFIHGGGWEGWT